MSQQNDDMDGGFKIKKSDPAIRIMETAETLFARKGFAAVSVREIAYQAEVQNSTIYYYFKKMVLHVFPHDRPVSGNGGSQEQV